MALIHKFAMLQWELSDNKIYFEGRSHDHVL